LAEEINDPPDGEGFLIIFIHHQVVERKNNNNLTKRNYYNIHSTISPCKSTKWCL